MAMNLLCISRQRAWAPDSGVQGDPAQAQQWSVAAREQGRKMSGEACTICPRLGTCGPKSHLTVLLAMKWAGSHYLYCAV